MQQAIDYEIRWQIEEIEDGRAIEQATVLFDPDTGETRAMRTKEDAADYRYFPDPDLPPLVIAPEWVERVRSEMPRLPRELAAEYVQLYELAPYLASQVTNSLEKSLLFESASIRNNDTDALPAERLNDPSFRNAFVRRVAVWVAGEVSRKMNESEGPSWQFWISGETLGRLALREHDGVISGKAAKQLFDKIWDEDRQRKACRGPDKVDELIDQLGLKQMSDTGALEQIIDEVIAANPENVAQFKAGKDKAFNALVGQAMKASKGKANPAQVNELLRRKLGP
jgi:aspartyl-tRNA(Asn)/glutamyl-tRNA(Gln) amidotransferase subunit B